jgi:E3 ubiquitin-protein ligase RNF216
MTSVGCHWLTRPVAIPFVMCRCEEVTKDAIETKGRLTVEEAITAAKIRKCPKCKNPFIKGDGCNKILCGCGTLSCYLCGQLISGYDHFCQTPHCKHESCNKCLLYTNTEKDDEVAMRTAGLSAASNVKAKMAEIASKDVNIDVESILKKPTANAVPNPSQLRGAPTL